MTRGHESSAVLSARASGYVFDIPREAVDIHRFQKDSHHSRTGTTPKRENQAAAATLRLALDLWAGLPLVDFPGLDLPRAARVQLGARRIAALCDRVEAEFGLARSPASLIDELEALAKRESSSRTSAG